MAEGGADQAVAKVTAGRQPLTDREVEVLRHLARALTDREIASELGISVRTVEHHVSNILAKIGQRRRSGAAVYALRRELGQPDD